MQSSEVRGWYSASERRGGILQPKCWDGTLQSATPAHRTRWVKTENYDQAIVFRFGTLRQWCVKFLPRIFYPFWPLHSRKFRFGRFDHGATKWCFRPACDQNLGSVLLTIGRLFPYLGTFDQWCD